jgi:hypothetical protein
MNLAVYGNGLMALVHFAAAVNLKLNDENMVLWARVNLFLHFLKAPITFYGIH